MNRRHFIQTTAALAAAPAFASPDDYRIDVNLSVGTWPFRTLSPLDGAALKVRGIHQALTGSLEAILHRDISSVNRRLAGVCTNSNGVLIPVGALHPLLPDWHGDLRRCQEEHGMKVIRLHPNYHGYTLADPIFRDVLAVATERGLAIQISTQLEDQRTQHPLVQAAPVDLSPLPDLLKSHPRARVMALNANAAMVMKALRGCTALWLDCAMIEGVGGIENLLKTWPLDKLCLGTHAPLFYPESSLLKLQESELNTTQQTAITRQNAISFLGQ